MIEASCPAELDGRALLHSSFSTYSMTGRTGRYTPPAGVFLAIFMTPPRIEADVDIFGRAKLYAGERADRAGFDADRAFPTGLIYHGACLQGGIGEYRDETNPGTKRFG